MDRSQSHSRCWCIAWSLLSNNATDWRFPSFNWFNWFIITFIIKIKFHTIEWCWNWKSNWCHVSTIRIDGNLYGSRHARLWTSRTYECILGCYICASGLILFIKKNKIFLLLLFVIVVLLLIGLIRFNVELALYHENGLFRWREDNVSILWSLYITNNDDDDRMFE